MLVAVESREDVVVTRPDADMSYLKEALNQTIKMIAQFGRELTDVNKDVDGERKSHAFLKSLVMIQSFCKQGLAMNL